MKKFLTIFLSFCFLLFFCFYALDRSFIHDWDEARNGQNALEMLRSGQWFFLTYNNALDTWNAKPPLLAALIAGSYSVFGVNAFALRFVSALSAWISLLYAFRLAKLWTHWAMALFCCTMLASSKGLLGFHTGRTGDFDAPLLGCISAFCFYGFSAVETGKKAMWVKCYLAFFLGELFKGTAMFQVLPGLLFWRAYTLKPMLKQLFSPRGLLGVVAATLPLCLWLGWKFIVETVLLKGSSSLSTATVYDVWTRLTQPIGCGYHLMSFKVTFTHFYHNPYAAS